MRDFASLRERVDAYSGRQREIASRADLHPARLCQLLTGKSPSLPLAQAAQLEHILGTSPGELFVVDDPALSHAAIDPYLPSARTGRRLRKQAS